MSMTGGAIRSAGRFCSAILLAIVKASSTLILSCSNWGPFHACIAPTASVAAHNFLYAIHHSARKHVLVLS